MDPYLKKLINEEVCAENATLKKKVQELTKRLFEHAEHSKMMRTSYLKELGTLRNAGQLEADTNYKKQQEALNMEKSGTKRRLSFIR